MVFGTRVLKYWVLGPSGFRTSDLVLQQLEEETSRLQSSFHCGPPRRYLAGSFLQASKALTWVVSRAPKDHIKISILQNMIFLVPLCQVLELVLVSRCSFEALIKRGPK